MTITYGILMFPDMEELDAFGPWEVFTMAASGVEGERAVTVTRDGGPVRCRKGLRVSPDHGFADCPPLDVLLVPGGDGTRALLDDGETLDWIARTAAGCRFAASVCTGALPLVRSGVARGRRVTTYYAMIETLRAWGEAEVLSGVRYVQDGRVVTAAGVSAGIDMALWLVGRLHSPAYAREVQQWMEYFPTPPYTAETAGAA